MTITIVPSHTFDLGDGLVLATHIPAGSWDVRVFEVPASHGLCLAYAAGRDPGNQGDSFAIAAGRPYSDVARAARAWVASATATVSNDRIRYTGRFYGHTTEGN
jgi:hypothetical protein